MKIGMIDFNNPNKKFKNRIERENLKDLKAVETYFVKRMADSIRALNKTVIGWDEIVDHQLDTDNSLVMWWRHDQTKKLEAALNGNYNVVMCPRIPLYFDFDQDESHKYGRKWGGAYSPIEMGYASGLHRDALIATAVVLFVFILIINISFALLRQSK